MRPGAFAAVATRSLPRDIGSFTDRQPKLAQLMGAIEARAANGGVVGIHAIDGMAGIGKTAFAVHAAHRLAEAFPDGSSSCRCTPTHVASDRWTRPMRWPACC